MKGTEVTHQGLTIGLFQEIFIVARIGAKDSAHFGAVAVVEVEVSLRDSMIKVSTDLVVGMDVVAVAVAAVGVGLYVGIALLLVTSLWIAQI